MPLPRYLVVSLIHVLGGLQAPPRNIRDFFTPHRRIQQRGWVAFVIAHADPRAVRDALLRHAVAGPAESDGVVVPQIRFRDLEVFLRNDHLKVGLLRLTRTKTVLLHERPEGPDQIIEEVEIVVVHFRREQ